MLLDIPDQARNKVIAEGNAAWLDELPSVVESSAQECSLIISATLRGGHAALVVEVVLAEGRRLFSRSVFRGHGKPTSRRESDGERADRPMPRS